MAHEFGSGDIFVYKWGYDQTNIEFHQVVKTTTKTVTVRRIEAKAVSEERFMSDTCVAVPDQFIEQAEPRRKTVKEDGSLRFEFGNAYPWDGKPRERSWYA